MPPACRECKSYGRSQCRHCSICKSPHHDKRTHDKSGHDSSIGVGISIIPNRLQPLQPPLQPPPVSAHSPSIKSDSESSNDSDNGSSDDSDDGSSDDSDNDSSDDDSSAEDESTDDDHSAEIAHLHELLEEQSRKHAAEIARLEQKIASITVSDSPVAGSHSKKSNKAKLTSKADKRS
jgi:hypothetical protein